MAAGAAAVSSVLTGVDSSENTCVSGNFNPNGLLGDDFSLLHLRDIHTARGMGMYRIIAPLTAVATLPPAAHAHLEIKTVGDLGGLFAVVSAPPPRPTPPLVAPSVVDEDGMMSLEFEEARLFFERNPPGRQPPATYKTGQCKTMLTKPVFGPRV
jgi:hypothetical protein